MVVGAGTLAAQDRLSHSLVETEQSSSSKTIKVAALSYLGKEETLREWQSTMQWLRDELPQYDFELITATHEEMHELVGRREVDYVITNPGLYSLLHYEYGINHMLSEVYATDNLSSLTLGSTLIKRKDNHTIERLEDLTERSMAVVSKDAFGGYQVMLRELRSRHIEPDKDTQVKQVGTPMSNVLDAVVSGEVDVGVIRACVLESVPDWESSFTVIEPVDNSDFPCLVSTRLYPGWVFAGVTNDHLGVTRDIMLSLLQLPPYSTASGDMYWSVLSNTQALYDLFRELEIGVYSSTSPSLWDYFKRYWWVLAVVVFVFFCGALYTVQVRYLVRKKTADLEFALAQQKTLQDKINEVQEQANHQAKLVILGEMSGTLAHELNQPLATIGNYSRSLLRRLDNHRLTDDDIRLAAQEVTEQTERASSIIKGVRSFARKRPMQLEKVSVKKISEEAIQLFGGMLSLPPKIRLFNFLDDNRMFVVDPVQIQQALINLLKNGYDAMLDADVDRPLMHLILWISDNRINLSVQDNGPGLTEEDYANLFETFYTSKQEGLGLGLSVCRTIAEAHGGKLETDTLPLDKSIKTLNGAIFTLSLPV